MTISIWRYSHLGLALSFSVFILLAALTGIILAFEPINKQLESYSISSEAENQSVAKTISILKQEYLEVVSFEINSHNQTIADVVTQDGKSERIFVNPINGKKIGTPKEKTPIYKWATSLHRSLFFKKTGRILVGLCSLFLCIIALTGVVLISKRQGGFLQFFTKVVKEKSYQYLHIVLGRWSLIPILVLTLSGIYLSLEKFSLLPRTHITHNIYFDELKASPRKSLENFESFKNISLNDIKQIEFPFSNDVEDYYTLYLNNKELVINQITGNIISEQEYPLHKLLSYYSLLLHTGHGSIVWSLILLLACIGIIYFLYSGFAMTLARKKTKIKNTINKDQAEIIILVGSEGGTTLNYAKALYKKLLKHKLKAYLTELNKFSKFSSAKKILIITATYGDGQAPTNAKKFFNQLDKYPLQQNVEFAILGFGSSAYTYFCKFAFDIQKKFYGLPNVNEAIELTTIDNGAFETYSQWINKVSKYLNIDINIQKKDLGIKKLKTKPFVVKEITPLEKQIDNTFLLELAPSKKLFFTSGDLLAIYPKKDDKERLYSISKTKYNTVLICVKKHEKGIVSNYLHQLEVNEKFEAAIIKNPNFHFPKKSPQIILIATGTGIGPFLGMIVSNTKKIPIHLFWGGRNEISYNLYKTIIEKQLDKKQLNSFYPAYSRSKLPKTYVQDLILAKKDFISNSLNNKAVIMICGSVSMQKGVLEVLDQICQEKVNKPFSYYENKGQLLMDCY